MRINKIFLWGVSLMGTGSAITGGFLMQNQQNTGHWDNPHRHELPHGTTLIKPAWENVKVVGGFVIKGTKIIGLNLSGHLSKTLIVGKNITAIDSQAFVNCSPDLERIIFETNENLVFGMNTFASLPERTEYCIINPNLRPKLIEAGVKGKIVNVSYDPDQKFIVQNGKELIGLSTSVEGCIDLLTLPKGITKIAANIINWSQSSIARINLNDQDQPIEQIDQDAFRQLLLTEPLFETSYYVNHDATALNLLNTNTRYDSIINEQEQANYFVSRGVVYKVNEQKQNHLIGLTERAKKDKVLFISNDANAITENAFKDCSATTIEFGWIEESKFKIEGNPFKNLAATTRYKVKSSLMKNKLIGAGVNEANIDVEFLADHTPEINDERLVNFQETNLTCVGGFIVEGQKIIGLTEEGKKSSSLVIAKNITAVEAGIFNQCSPDLRRIILETDHLEIGNDPFNGVAQTTDYCVLNSDLKQRLIDAGIKNQIIDAHYDASKNFIVGADGELIGLSTMANGRTLKLPKGINKIVTAAFNWCPASVSAIFLNDQDRPIPVIEPNASGNIKPSVIFYVNDDETAVNLISSGNEKNLIWTENGSLNYELYFNRFIYKRSNNKYTLVGLTTQAKKQAVIHLPAITDAIGANAFKGCTVKTLELRSLDNEQIQIEKNPFQDLALSTRYKVKSDLMKRNLVSAGVNEVNIDVESWQRSKRQADQPKPANLIQKQTTNTGGFIIEDQKIVGLTEAGMKAAVLIVGKDVTAIKSGAFKQCSADLKRVIFEADHLTIEKDALDGVSSTVNYYILNANLRQELTAAGGQNKIIDVQYDSQKKFIINNQHEIIGLSLGLADSIEQLKLPDAVNKIATEAFNWCPVSLKRIFLNDQNQPIEMVESAALKGINSPIFYYLHRDETAISLLKAGVDSKLIFKKNSLVEYTVDENGFICKENKSAHTLIGLTLKAQKLSSILIPHHVNVIAADAFKHCSAETIDFSLVNDAQISLERNCFRHLAMNTRYRVKSESMKKNLIGMGINETNIDLVKSNDQVNAIDDVNLTASEQTRRRAVGGFIIEGTKIIDLTEAGMKASTLIVGKNITAIKPGTFNCHLLNLKRVIFESDNLTLDPHVFQGVPPTVNYYILNPNLRQKLEAIGVRNQIVDVQYDAQKTFIIDNQHEVIGLSLNLDDKLEQLKLPVAIDKIAAGAFNWCPRSVVTIFLNDQKQAIKVIETEAFNGVSPYATYYLNHDDTAINLISSGVQHQSIQKENRTAEYVAYSNDLIFKISDHGKHTMIGLTPKAQMQLVIFIPSRVDAISADAFKDSLATRIEFDRTDDKPIDLEGNPFRNLAKGVRYQVKTNLILEKLMSVGISRANIDRENSTNNDSKVGINSLVPEHVYLTSAGGFIIEGTKIIGLTNAGMKSSVLIVGKQISTIKANVFEDCSPDLKRIIFETSNLTIEKNAFKGVAQTVDYYIVNPNLRQQLVDAKVMNNIIDVQYDFQEKFIVHDQKEIVGLSLSIDKNTLQLRLPKEINKVMFDAFSWCPLSVKTIFLNDYDHPLEIDKDAFSEARTVSLYYVNHEHTALNLINSGIIYDSIRKEGERITYQVLEGDFVCRDDAYQNWTLIGLTARAKNRENLFLSERIKTISGHAFKDCLAKRICFSPDAKTDLKIEGNPFKDLLAITCYEVDDVVTKRKLMNAGVSEAKIIVNSVESLKESAKKAVAKQDWALGTKIGVIVGATLGGLTTLGIALSIFFLIKRRKK